MAFRVNGEGFLLSDYEEELRRYQAAMEETGELFDASAASKTILDEMINQMFLAQHAAQEGFVVDEAALQMRLEELATGIGGVEALVKWINDYSFSEESFRRALARDMAAVWMRNRILGSVPTTADQVHARQILVRSENEAIASERRLQVGTDFNTLAYEYDPLSGGDLGWFPAGYLLQTDVEIAAFSLQPGQYSPIIPTSYGYHIVYVIERDQNHPLSPEALLFTQRLAMENWLNEQRNQSSVEIYVQ